MLTHHLRPPPPPPWIGNTNQKAAEEDAVGAYGAEPEPEPVAPEATAVPESAGGAESYDFKEYDLKEYDPGTADSRLYDYGAYDEYGTAHPAPKAASYDDEVGPGVAAETETEVSESSVSTPTPTAIIIRMARIPLAGSPSPRSVHRSHARCLVFGSGRRCLRGIVPASVLS